MRLAGLHVQTRCSAFWGDDTHRLKTRPPQTLSYTSVRVERKSGRVTHRILRILPQINLRAVVKKLRVVKCSERTMSKHEPSTENQEIVVRPARALSNDNGDTDVDWFSDGSRDSLSVRGGGGDGWWRRTFRSVFGPSLTNISLLTLAACLLLPTMLVDGVLYPLFRLVFGTLYPAYASYKAVRSKDVKEYVKWMMYWIVFALFTSAETFTDVFLGFWFPFYYEVKVILVFWLLSPMTKGSSFLYRKFVHPALSKREQDIDEYIARAKDQGYSTVLSLGTKGVNYATAVIMQTAIKGGGGLVNQLRRSYSLSDISMGMDEMNRAQARTNESQDRTDSTGNGENRSSRQRAYSSRPGVEMYFPEVDVDVRQRGPRESSVPLSQIRSTEDVSSGYSSAEPLYARAPTEDPREALVRTSSVGSARVTRTRTTRAAATPGVKTRAAPTEVTGFATLPRSKKIPKKKVQ